MTTDRLAPVGFRLQFWRLYLVMLPATYLCIGLLVAAAMVLGEIPTWKLPALAVGTTSAALLPVALGMVFLTHVRVDPSGVRSGDLFGFPVTVPWGSIQTVTAFNFVGLPYLRVRSSASRRAMWLPVFLAKYEAFARLVEKYAGPDNPLTAAVLERLNVEE